jgi:hypothetical protein
MAERNPWEPKPLLEERPWSLLPNLGVPAWSARAALVAWLCVVVVAQLAAAPGWPRLFPGAIGGAWSVYYVACRFGGRAAPTGGASPSIKVDSPFQARLAFDLIAVVVLLVALTLLFTQ